MLDLPTMIELGALGGAISLAHSFSGALEQAGDKVDHGTAWVVSFLVAPVLGGVWGSILGASVYFVVSFAKSTF